MNYRLLYTVILTSLVLLTSAAISQEGPPDRRNLSPQQRAEATRNFLGLGPAPDAAAAARGAPLFQQDCSFCHGPQARGAEGPDLITSQLVLDDAHGDKLIPFLKVGRPGSGMPSFANVSDNELKDIVEFVHLQVENVANRGTYHVLNILVGNAAQGKAYVDAHCMSCHGADTFDHIASKFRTPDQLQRGWVWPERPGDPSTAISAIVTLPDGGSIAGRVTQISDFLITIVDASGQTHSIDRGPGVNVQLHDPLGAHQAIIMTLKNEDMHDVTAYLETLK